jgi:hypothetical protein
MGESPSTMHIDIDLGPGADTDERDQQVRWLRSELLELDVEAVERLGGTAVPEGARGPAADLAGTLVITLSNSAVLVAVVGVLRAWVSRGSGRKVKMQVGSDSIEVGGLSAQDQDKLIESWIQRYAK